MIIEEDDTGIMYGGDESRDMLDCPYGSTKHIQKDPLRGVDCTVWFQSWSVNRKLKPGQDVMVDMRREKPRKGAWITSR